MAKIAFLGLGAMGSRMAINLLKSGNHQLTVWNRTPTVGEDVVQAGAIRAKTAKDAVQGADIVISMVRDDEVSRHIWLDEADGVLSALAPHAVAIESSTLTVDWIRELGAVMQQRGIAFLEAPVSGSRPQAELAQLVFLVGGQQETYLKVKEVLAEMGKVAESVIGDLGAGALAKLCTNTLMAAQVAVLAELVGTLKRNQADVAQTIAALATTPAWSMVCQRAADSFLAENFAPLFPIELLQKDLGYTLKSVGDSAKAPVVSATNQAFKNAIAQGLGGEQMTAVVKLYC